MGAQDKAAAGPLDPRPARCHSPTSGRRVPFCLITISIRIQHLHNPLPGFSSFEIYFSPSRSLVLVLSFNMWSKLLALTAATFFAFYSTALGQTNFTTNWNPTGEGCVDTTGFISCYNDHTNTGVSCQETCANNNKKGTAEYNTCMNACEALWLAGNVGCWLQSCWNQVCFLPHSPFIS
jgi:hypothetical protein